MIHVTNLLQLDCKRRCHAPLMWSCEKADGIQSSKVSARTIMKHCCRVCGKTVEQNKKKTKALFTVVGLRDSIIRDWPSPKICPNLPARSASPTSTNLLACKHNQNNSGQNLSMHWWKQWDIGVLSTGDWKSIRELMQLLSLLSSSTFAGSPTRIPIPKRILPTTPHNQQTSQLRSV